MTTIKQQKLVNDRLKIHLTLCGTYALLAH